MDVTVLFFLTSGMFLGWALGANHLGNVFGTAVGSRMITWFTAALFCSVFVVLGSVVSGAGAAKTLGKLGAVNALPGSFMTALAAGFSVYVMTRLGLPVSTTQAIFGGIIGWNLFSDTVTNRSAAVEILTSWIGGPVLSAIFAMILLKITVAFLRYAKLHMLRVDAYTRLGLIVAGAFGAYSLGANNIANVMGVFVASSPFTEFNFLGLFPVSSVQQLFLIGGIAIAVGVFTYSRKVVHTVGERLFPMTPIIAWVVVMSHSLVLFLFASEGLEAFLASHGLPTIPLVPISSSEVVIGAIIGIGLMRGGRGLRWQVLGKVASGWVVTPFISSIVCFIGLFFLQNVFGHEVYKPVPYTLSEPVLARLQQAGVDTAPLQDLRGRTFTASVQFERAVKKRMELTWDIEEKLLSYAEVDDIVIDPAKFGALDAEWLSPGQIEAIERLKGRIFKHRWQLSDALARISDDWRFKEKNKANKKYNKELQKKLDFVFRTFSVR